LCSALRTTGTTSGSKYVPRRARATSTAASAPPLRWNTSTMSARWRSSHRLRDVIAAETTWHALAVPSGERLLARVAHARPEAETLCHLPGGEAVREQGSLDALGA